MNFRKGRPREDLEINLIPFIDVLLVIVIFLMVTTTYSKFTALQVTLPTADAQKALEQPFEINIAIDANGRYAINNKRIAARDAQGLSEEMQAAVRSSGSKADPVIIINADALATHQTVVNVMEAARMAGYPKLTFAAQSSSK
ncbi:ExbD/TolR family protein [Herbaspirillum huttiense]|jgi:Biopolymer transport protein|uniref:Biopolymer transporter ExbD n=5 Tax=Pseudomonadota TaxID=1224 RepID=A0AAJ2LXG1_9BURK|nr:MULTISPECIES: biopolymer transporter ExbD [Herbaspirillum]MBW9336391.1 biopolymer transporter ExbD [Herbaspirillum sp. RU 5E]MAF01682.1 biopolymer transporter ExbD [Herbaspirillum sp.]MBO16601.1 biopolymer transporter ExbD [Herbaspirillum sp.]MCO4859804.1 biopolymer transporter ExbD [Herbaspirillum sp. WGmk3]MDR9839131.1 biopolymer transporter ExbD [Herbaspirillum huttiense]|tara:strand:+ start:7178 stop:7606 length:429 start_codon:yes stop_codon:yes gene_type:complete